MSAVNPRTLPVQAVFFDLYGTLAQPPPRGRLARILDAALEPGEKWGIAPFLDFGPAGILAKAIGAAIFVTAETLRDICDVSIGWCGTSWMAGLGLP